MAANRIALWVCAFVCALAPFEAADASPLFLIISPPQNSGWDSSIVFFEDFSAGDIAWELDWDTDGGNDSYRDFYRVDRLRGGYLLRARCSYYATQSHDYFLEQIEQIIKPCSQLGFWDAERGNWASKLLWSPAEGWCGMVLHDWKYSIELEEGALMAAIVSGATAMDSCLAGELRYIHTRLTGEGGIDQLQLEYYPYEYGVTLSSLALGARYFRYRIGYTDVASVAYHDMALLYRFVATYWRTPALLTPDVAIILRGFVNAGVTYEKYGDERFAAAVMSRVRGIASFITVNQDQSGRLNVSTSAVERFPVQNQLKAAIAMVLAYRFVGDGSYLETARRCLDWVIANRWDISGKCMGGLYWNIEDTCNFYECHQMWLLIAAKYIEEDSGHSYAVERADALAFLTDDNFAGVDWYEHNLSTHGAFFAYRAISSDGAIQKDLLHLFKGAYEIGASLWAMALHYDDRDEGHARLITQSPLGAVRGWEQGIFTHRRFDADAMLFEWDVMFEDVSCRGAYTGLLEDREGGWLVLFDTDEGLRYRNEQNDEVVLFERSLLRSKRPYSVVVEKPNVNTAALSILEGGALVYQSGYVTVRDFDLAYFGALQMTDGPQRAKNIYIDNVKWVRGLRGLQVPVRLANFPNPFNAKTSIDFSIGSGERVSVEIYDVAGRLVKRLYRGAMGYGPHTLFWDATNEHDDPVASGVYLCILRMNGVTQSCKMILAR